MAGTGPRAGNSGEKATGGADNDDDVGDNGLAAIGAGVVSKTANGIAVAIGSRADNGDETVSRFGLAYVTICGTKGGVDKAVRSMSTG